MSFFKQENQPKVTSGAPSLFNLYLIILREFTNKMLVSIFASIYICMHRLHNIFTNLQDYNFSAISGNSFQGVFAQLNEELDEMGTIQQARTLQIKDGKWS